MPRWAGWLRRLLPRGWRERVFDPALADLLLDGAHRRPGFLGRVLWLWCESWRVGSLAQLIERRRLTRTGWALVGVLAVTTLLGVFAGITGNYHQVSG